MLLGHFFAALFLFVEVAKLSRFERPLPVMTDYDALLGREVAP